VKISAILGTDASPHENVMAMVCVGSSDSTAKIASASSYDEIFSNANIFPHALSSRMKLSYPLSMKIRIFLQGGFGFSLVLTLSKPGIHTPQTQRNRTSPLFPDSLYRKTHWRSNRFRNINIRNIFGEGDLISICHDDVGTCIEEGNMPFFHCRWGYGRVSGGPEFGESKGD